MQLHWVVLHRIRDYFGIYLSIYLYISYIDVYVLAIKMMWFHQKDRLTRLTVHSDFKGQGKYDGTWCQASAIWRFLFVVLHSSAFFFGDICTFFLSLSWSYESSWIKNPCITKQLDQKPPVMQQGSAAPYLLPRWEMAGESASGWEGPQDGNKGGRTARAPVWVTDAATFHRVSSVWTVYIARLV